MNEQIRKEFEQWAKDKAHLDSFEVDGEKRYASLTATTMWQSWQAAHARYAGSGEASATTGMNLGERIAHVGGRENEQGYIEFGSPMAIRALIDHVLRDIASPPAQPKVPDETVRELLDAIGAVRDIQALGHGRPEYTISSARKEREVWGNLRDATSRIESMLSAQENNK